MAHRNELDIAVVDFHTTWGDVDANIESMRSWVRRARERGADLVLFPEMCLTGYDAVSDAASDVSMPAREAQEVPGAATDALCSIAAEEGVWIVFGMPQADGGRCYNAAVVVDPENGVVACYRKMHLPNDEAAWAARGDAPCVFETPWGPMGLGICYDTYNFPELMSYARARGARLFLNPTAICWDWFSADVFKKKLEAHCLCTNMVVASSNLVGLDARCTFRGCSNVVGPFGEMGDVRYLAGHPFGDGEGEQEGVHVAHVDLSLLDGQAISSLARPFGVNPYTGKADWRGELYARMYSEAAGGEARFQERGAVKTGLSPSSASASSQKGRGGGAAANGPAGVTGDARARYAQWLDALEGEDLDALLSLEESPEELEDAFYRELAFGTAGLRGVLGMGSNRMNRYTVGKATQGLADYLNARFESPSVVLCRDSRLQGKLFVSYAAAVLAANGIKAYVFPRVEPTPTLSFAVRDLHCTAGINVTASHNPSCYNGYKVYGPDGCQIASDMARGIQEAIDQVDCFADVRAIGFKDGVDAGRIEWVGNDVIDRFVDAVAAESVAAPESADVPLRLAYTPLNGTGMECVGRILQRIGIDDVHVVREQARPDGEFPTCPYPNPETREALELGLALAEEGECDLLLATDPDADRVGVAVRHDDGYVLLTGNEIGVLLADYLCRMRAERGEDISEKVVVTTVVSSTMPDALARRHGFQLRRTLTGFKYIGGQIALLEQEGRPDRFMLGFEESYGYMSGTHVRDKDAVNAVMLVCEMARWHKGRGSDLVEAMQDLYDEYGYHLNKTVNIEYPGAEGARRMREIMERAHGDAPTSMAGSAVAETVDYTSGAQMPQVNRGRDAEQVLPAADVVEYLLEDGSKVVVRPSGTEPKIKAYLFANAPAREDAQRRIEELEKAARLMLE